MFVHTTARNLPDQRTLVAAFGGQLGTAENPVTGWAHALAELHRQRQLDPLAAAGIDCRRAELVATLDNWVVEHVPHRQATAHIHAQSVGATIDRMAAAHVHASHLLYTAEQVSDARVHAAWYRLALIADEWTDLLLGAARERVRGRRPA
ncbi:DUF4254 domain-containing protein [Nocardia sp. NPDC052566]|uniref:DUF4254 domain-containing protein n=1 Tax=Nocardia sp. NPDC052566 TaxID=3364330 RepID=UPI0037CB9ED0